MLIQRNEPYVASRDEQGTWRILNTWHPELKETGVDADFDIKDDHPAVTLITEGAFLALIKEATSQGLLEGNELSYDEYDDVRLERDKLKEELDNLQGMHQEILINGNGHKSEPFELSNRKLDLLKQYIAQAGNDVDNETIQLILKVGGNSEID